MGNNMNDLSRDVIEKLLDKSILWQIETSHSYSSGLRRIATWQNSWVRYAYQDNESGKTLAILFDEDYEDVLEYSMRAVQAYSSCIVCFSLSLLQNASELVSTIAQKDLGSLAIGVIAYDGALNISVIRKMAIPSNYATARSSSEQKSYWCWWRDASHYEVATLLQLSSEYDEEDGDIYTQYVYPRFFEMMLNGETKKWDGSPRAKTYSTSSYKAEKQNYKIPMFQLGFWDADTGHLTHKGKALLNLVNTFGSDSKEYFDSLAKTILIDGKHLDLIKDLDEFQKGCPELIPESSAEFFVLFDDYMMSKNSMGTRKPSAVTTGAKKAYIRDEPKLWNKLGLINLVNGARYFQPFHGIDFNWKRINEILLTSAYEEKYYGFI